MKLRCELCKREVDFEFTTNIFLELYLHALHLNIVHCYPDAFRLEYDGEGRWLVDGKVVFVDAEKVPRASQ